MAGYINKEHMSSMQVWSVKSFEKDALKYIRYVISHNPSVKTLNEIKKDLEILKSNSRDRLGVVQKWAIRGLDSEINVLETAIHAEKK
jgi:hypothetical protein